MDPGEKEKQSQSLGICHKLFYYIMKTLTAQALKPVTLGHPSPLPNNHLTQKKPGAPPGGSAPTNGLSATTLVHPTEEGSESSVSVTGSSLSAGDGEGDGEWFRILEVNDEACSTLNTTGLNETGVAGSYGDREKVLGRVVSDTGGAAPGRRGGPKKKVSIKDEAEVIDFKKKKRKLMTTGETKQMPGMRNDDETKLKPLKSILRVGSDVNEESTAA